VRVGKHARLPSSDGDGKPQGAHGAEESRAPLHTAGPGTPEAPRAIPGVPGSNGGSSLAAGYQPRGGSASAAAASWIGAALAPGSHAAVAVAAASSPGAGIEPGPREFAAAQPASPLRAQRSGSGSSDASQRGSSSADAASRRGSLGSLLEQAPGGGAEPGGALRLAAPAPLAVIAEGTSLGPRLPPRQPLPAAPAPASPPGAAGSAGPASGPPPPPPPHPHTPPSRPQQRRSWAWSAEAGSPFAARAQPWVGPPPGGPSLAGAAGAVGSPAPGSGDLGSPPRGAVEPGAGARERQMTDDEDEGAVALLPQLSLASAASGSDAGGDGGEAVPGSPGAVRQARPAPAPALLGCKHGSFGAPEAISMHVEDLLAVASAVAKPCMWVSWGPLHRVCCEQRAQPLAPAWARRLHAQAAAGDLQHCMRACLHVSLGRVSPHAPPQHPRLSHQRWGPCRAAQVPRLKYMNVSRIAPNRVCCNALLAAYARAKPPQCEKVRLLRGLCGMRCMSVR